jgi:hypothetical protein
MGWCALFKTIFFFLYQNSNCFYLIYYNISRKDPVIQLVWYETIEGETFRSDETLWLDKI